MVGRTISHYRILAKLGEGGMGSVYKAHDQKLDRDVALKFIIGGFSRDDDKKRFIREAQAAASLQHPNICPIYEVDEFQGRIFFVMAFLEGKTLAELIEEGALPIEQAVSVARQVAAGLEEAHDQGIIHRDIKSSNIVVNSKGRAILLDFGLAQRAGQSRLTATGAAMGTAPYMSPEQAQDELTDAQTDLWSLGVVLYEALAGQLPFESPHHLATLYSIINEPPPRRSPNIDQRFRQTLRAWSSAPLRRTRRSAIRPPRKSWRTWEANRPINRRSLGHGWYRWRRLMIPEVDRSG